MRKKIFLRWALLTTLVLVTGIIAWRLKAFHLAYHTDASRLTFVILTLFFAATAWCGRLTWLANTAIENGGSAGKILFIKEIKNLENHSRIIDEAASICTLLGLLGTIIGIIMAFFGDGKFKGLEQQDQLGIAVGTAFITTFAGLVCCILLMVQLTNLRHALQRAAIEMEGEDG